MTQKVSTLLRTDNGICKPVTAPSVLMYQEITLTFFVMDVKIFGCLSFSGLAGTTLYESL